MLSGAFCVPETRGVTLAGLPAVAAELSLKSLISLITGLWDALYARLSA